MLPLWTQLTKQNQCKSGKEKCKVSKKETIIHKSSYDVQHFQQIYNNVLEKQHLKQHLVKWAEGI